MNNALSFDIEDWFQVENLKSAITPSRWDEMELRVVQSTRLILALLRESGAKATFFVLGWVAERCPELVREIDGDGHEVASHGYAHQLIYELTPAAFREDLQRSCQILQAITGKKVRGYRAPSFSITPASQWALDILKEEGFEYDSSIFPVSMHDRYGFPGVDAVPFRWPNGLVEIPLSVLRIGKLSLPAAGGGYFRLFPYTYFRRVFVAKNRCHEPATFYMHPWEMDHGQPRVAVPWLYRFRHYVNLHKTEGRLRQLLSDFRFAGLYDVHRVDRIAVGECVPRRKRLVFIIDAIGTAQAGTENQLLKLIDGLDAERFELHLVCLSPQPWFAENRSALKCATYLVEIHRFKSLGAYVNLLRLARLLRRIQPDLVQTFFPVGNIIGVLAARMAGIKHIVSSRRDYGEWMRRDYLLATRWANRFVERVVVNSPSVQEVTQRREKVDADRIDVLANGIDLRQFAKLGRDESLKTRLGLQAAGKVVTLVGNFRAVKRHDTLLLAAKRVLEVRADVDFLLLGKNVTNEDTRDQLERMAARLGIDGRVHFIGAQSQVTPFLSITDVGVNCSEREGFSNAVMEYMAMEVPCVVSDNPGNLDLVTAGLTGSVIAVGDDAALATEILRLFDDAAYRDAMVTAAGKRVEEQLALPAMLANYAAYYERLIGNDATA